MTSAPRVGELYLCRATGEAFIVTYGYGRGHVVLQNGRRTVYTPRRRVSPNYVPLVRPLAVVLAPKAGR
jgi:hypothetical protein